MAITKAGAQVANMSRPKLFAIANAARAASQRRFLPSLILFPSRKIVL